MVRRRRVRRPARRRFIRSISTTAGAKPTGEADTFDKAVQNLLAAIQQGKAAGEAERAAEDLADIYQAEQLLKKAKRSALVASKSDRSFGRLGLPVNDKIADGLVNDRLEVLNDRRHLIWKSGAVGAALGAVIAGAFAVLLWWLQQGAPAPPA